MRWIQRPALDSPGIWKLEIPVSACSSHSPPDEDEDEDRAREKTLSAYIANNCKTADASLPAAGAE